RMIELALKGGGTDNVTVIVADVVDVDFGEDAPIVGGAAGDGTDEGPPVDSPAARARALTAPPPPPPAPQQTEQLETQPDPKAKRRKRLRLLLAFGLALVLLAAAAFATRYFVLRQYYVGVDEETSEVVVYQGVPGSILGFKLQQKAEGSCPPEASLCDPLMLEDLQQDARAAVSNGVKRDGLVESREYINTLRHNNMLEICDDESDQAQGGGLGGIEQGGETQDAAEGATPGAPNEPTNTTAAGRNEGGQRPGVDCRPAPSSGGN